MKDSQLMMGVVSERKASPMAGESMESGDVDKAKAKKEEKKVKVTTQPGVIKVGLPDDVSERVSKTLQTLKERGLEIKAEELLKPMLLTITQAELDKLLVNLTPDDYYLEQAKNLPEVRAAFIKQAKRVLLSGGVKTVRGPRKKRLFADESIGQSNLTNGEGGTGR